MYDNIGEKIKGLAKAQFIVETIAAVITGIALMNVVDDLIPVGLLVMVVGPIVALASSWLLYGFGELIDKTCDIERNTRGEERKSEAQANADTTKFACPKCGKIVTFGTASCDCGQVFDWTKM